MSISIPRDVRRQWRGVTSRTLGLQARISDPTKRCDGDEKDEDEDEPCIDVRVKILLLHEILSDEEGLQEQDQDTIAT